MVVGDGRVPVVAVCPAQVIAVAAARILVEGYDLVRGAAIDRIDDDVADVQMLALNAANAGAGHDAPSSGTNVSEPLTRR